LLISAPLLIKNLTTSNIWSLSITICNNVNHVNKHNDPPIKYVKTFDHYKLFVDHGSTYHESIKLIDIEYPYQLYMNYNDGDECRDIGKG
jgi:hypothetical protein